MPSGGGKYEPECELVRKNTEAAACVVIVIDGNRGGGFSVSVDMSRAVVTPLVLAKILRDVAGEIEKS